MAATAVAAAAACRELTSWRTSRHPAAARTCSVEMASPAVLSGSKAPNSSLVSSGTLSPAHSTPTAWWQ